MPVYNYEVKFKVGNSTRCQTMNLHYGTESEAIETLYRQGSVNRSERIIILGIIRRN